MVILISKKLIEHDISLGYFEDNGQLFWIEDGGSDGVDVLINLDEQTGILRSPPTWVKK